MNYKNRDKLSNSRQTATSNFQLLSIPNHTINTSEFFLALPF